MNGTRVTYTSIKRTENEIQLRYNDGNKMRQKWKRIVHTWKVKGDVDGNKFIL